MSFYVFQHDGDCGFSGIWSTITSARGFDAKLIQPPAEATHWVRYITGSTAQLVQGELVTGGTSTSTARVVAQIIEQGTIGATTASGILLLQNPSGAFQAETLTGSKATGTCIIAQALIPIEYRGPAKTAVITVETADIQFSYSGQDPTVTAGTNEGFLLPKGSNFTLRFPHNIMKFKAINAVAGSGSILKYALHF